MKGSSAVGGRAGGLRRIAVYCGYRGGNRPAFRGAARALGSELAVRGIELVYGGGGGDGLMGTVADAALEAGGRVTGVIPRMLVEREQAHRGLSAMHVVESMHARKARMLELSDACVVLPGGLGTLDELFEVLSWAQLGLHERPCGMINVEGYFDPLLAFLDRAVRCELLRPVDRDLLRVAPTPAGVLRGLRQWRARERVERGDAGDA